MSFVWCMFLGGQKSARELAPFVMVPVGGLQMLHSEASASGLFLAAAALMAWPLFLIAVALVARLMWRRRVRSRIRFVYADGRIQQPVRILKPMLHGRTISSRHFDRRATINNRFRSEG